jgi:hypothetical protein
MCPDRCRLELAGAAPAASHVVVPRDGTADFDEEAAFAHRAGAPLVKRHPKRLTQELRKADRRGRVLVDTSRDGWSATCGAVYTGAGPVRYPGLGADATMMLAGAGRARAAGVRPFSTAR